MNVAAPHCGFVHSRLKRVILLFLIYFVVFEHRQLDLLVLVLLDLWLCVVLLLFLLLTCKHPYITAKAMMQTKSADDASEREK